MLIRREFQELSKISSHQFPDRSIESTLAVLNKRFPDTEVETLTPALEDLNRLKHLNLEASFIETFDAFKDPLEA